MREGQGIMDDKEKRRQKRDWQETTFDKTAMFESHGDMQLEENHTKPRRLAKRTQVTGNGTAAREKRKHTAFTSSLQMLRVSAFVRIR